MLDLNGGPCIYKRISGCGSGTEYMAVTPWGDFYPCHQFVGDERFRLGRCLERRDQHRDMQDAFRRLQRLHPSRLRATAGPSSTARGGCAANAYHATGSVNGVYKYGLRAVPQADGMRDYARSGQSAG